MNSNQNTGSIKQNIMVDRMSLTTIDRYSKTLGLYHMRTSGFHPSKHFLVRYRFLQERFDNVTDVGMLSSPIFIYQIANF